MKSEKIREVLSFLAEERGSDSSFCPSEAARKLAENNWRDLMSEVRREAAAMEAEGKLQVLQKGREVDINIAKGPVRLRKPPQ